MSRSGYTDDISDGGNWALIRWRGAVNAAIKGRRGQQLLRELRDALDAMPSKQLLANELITEEGCCALGAIISKRGWYPVLPDPDDYDTLAKLLDAAPALIRELMFENDEGVFEDVVWIRVELCGPPRPGYPEHGRHVREIAVPNPRLAELRWQHMHRWLDQHLAQEKS